MQEGNIHAVTFTQVGLNEITERLVLGEHQHPFPPFNGTIDNANQRLHLAGSVLALESDRGTVPQKMSWVVADLFNFCDGRQH